METKTLLLFRLNKQFNNLLTPLDSSPCGIVNIQQGKLNKIVAI